MIKLSITIQKITILISLCQWSESRHLIQKTLAKIVELDQLKVYLPELKKLSAWIHINHSEYEEAENDLIEGVRIAEQFNEQVTLADIYIHLGNCYFYQKELKKAYENYKISERIQLKLLKTKKNNQRILFIYSSVLNNLGRVLLEERMDYINALKYYKKSSKVCSKINRFGKNRGVIFLNISKIMIKQKQYTSAKTYLNRALKIFNGIQDPLWKAEALLTFSDLNLSINRIDDAITYLNQSLQINNKINYTKGLLSGYKKLGILFLLKDKNLTAKKYLSKAINIAEELRDEEELIQITKLMNEIKN
ncbi:MAG: tetratricopeptide repeat protein [bacterium]|nr:tetratricopeptide repeat protein [bacterium]